jgi:hypothetical protein
MFVSVLARLRTVANTLQERPNLIEALLRHELRATSVPVLAIAQSDQSRMYVVVHSRQRIACEVRSRSLRAFDPGHMSRVHQTGRNAIQRALVASTSARTAKTIINPMSTRITGLLQVNQLVGGSGV